MTTRNIIKMLIHFQRQLYVVFIIMSIKMMIYLLLVVDFLIVLLIISLDL